MKNILSLICLMLLCMTAPTVWGQGTTLGTIRGTVTDTTGAVVPNAEVVITDKATNIKTNLTTDGDGNYEAPDLRYGDYTVTVSMTGFNTAEIVGVALRGGGVIRVDAKLAPKTSTETVTVTSEAPLIHTENQTISQ